MAVESRHQPRPTGRRHRVTRAALALAAFLSLASLLTFGGCSSKPPTPTLANLDRYTLKLIARDGHTVLAETKFGERARGATIHVEDSQTSMNRFMGVDFALDFLNGEADSQARTDARR
jgi:hypothetical protein